MNACSKVKMDHVPWGQWVGLSQKLGFGLLYKKHLT